MRFQPIMNGTQANNAMLFRPKRSANGPTMIDPIGKQMVTMLARIYIKYKSLLAESA